VREHYPLRQPGRTRGVRQHDDIVRGIDVTRPQSPDEVEAILQLLDEHLVVAFPGQRMDLDRLETFTDELGRPFAFKQWFPGDKPVVLMLGYYQCPAMCGQVLEAAFTARAVPAFSLLPSWSATTKTLLDIRRAPSSSARQRVPRRL
jgi:hypothetical protein